MVLAILIGGAATQLIQSVFNFLFAHPKHGIEVTRPDGATLRISAETVNAQGERAFDTVRRFLEEGPDAPSSVVDRK
ncbi:effector-associated constant component EACC1 [Caballeronia sp. INML1]|uniref:effector-associated constant component EACC1 n=1 Tax=Caballeronia sp. INML1 TaxID=2921760 RepID=UPI003906BACA